MSRHADSSVKVPNVSRFEEWWNFLWDKERAFNELWRRAKVMNGTRGGSHVRMLVGVFSRVGCADFAYRQVIRKTWMQQPGICPLPHNASANCSVYTTFVTGNDGPSTGETDVTRLPIAENMNGGKTRLWFQFASRHAEWATHVAKQDMDAFPHLSQIVNSIIAWSPRCKNVYGGVPVICTGQEGSSCVAASGCGLFQNGDFLNYGKNGSRNPDCFSYMQGAFYFVTKDLAKGFGEKGEWWDSASAERCDAEDMQTGRAIKMYGIKKRICIAGLALPKHRTVWHRFKEGHQTGHKKGASKC